MSRILILLFVAAIAGLSLAADPPVAPPAAPLPRRVTLPEETLPLSKALEAIDKQTGILVRDNRSDKDIPVTLPKAERTFWETLDALADAADLQPYGFNGNGALSLVPRRAGVKPQVSLSGSFRYSLLRLTSTNDFDGGGRSCSARIQVLWEPTLKPFYINDRPTIVTAIGDKDAKAIVLKAGDVESLAPIDGRIGQVADVPVPVVDRVNSKLTTLSGSMKVLAPGKMVTFKFMDLVAKASLTQDDITCVIEDFTPDWSVKIRFKAPAGKKFESYMSWIVHNEMSLVSLDGKRRIPGIFFNVPSMSSKEAVVNYKFANTPAAPLGKRENWNLIYTTPASIVEMTVPFTFKNVELP